MKSLNGARFWFGILNGLQNRGVNDILIVCVDGLKGLPDAIDDDTELLIAIAGEIHWTIDEVEQYFVEYDLVSSDDGLPYYYLATFSEDTPDKLKEIAGLNTSNQTHLDLNFLPDPDGEENG